MNALHHFDPSVTKPKSLNCGRGCENAAKSNENMMPLFIECVENNLTLGEICNTLRSVWGEYVAEGF